MATLKRSSKRKLRGQTAIAHSLSQVIQETFRLWRRHHLDYDQTKYVVERVRRRLTLEPSRTRNRTVDRLDRSDVERLIQATYRIQSKYGLMIKTLFQTRTRLDEFVHIRVEDLLLDGDPPQIHITHAKRQADRYVPILPALADELRTHLQGRQQGFLFESNRHTRYSTRIMQAIVEGLRLPGRHRKAGLPASTPAFGGHDFARFRPGSHRPGAEVLGPLASFDHANLC